MISTFVRFYTLVAKHATFVKCLLFSPALSPAKLTGAAGAAGAAGAPAHASGGI